MIQARANLAKFNATIDRAKTGLEVVAITQAKQAAELVVDYMGRYAPEDTTKFKRGIILAGRQIGVGTLPLPNIEKSKYAVALLSTLQKQVVFHRNRLAGLRNALQKQQALESGRKRRINAAVGKSKKVARLEAQIATAIERVHRAEEQVTKLLTNPSSTVIRRKVAYVLAGNQKHDEKGYGVDIEVRDRVYGGAGRIYITKKQVHILMQVLEPYALSVERRSQVRQRAMWWARSQIKFTGPKSMFR